MEGSKQMRLTTTPSSAMADTEASSKWYQCWSNWFLAYAVSGSGQRGSDGRCDCRLTQSKIINVPVTWQLKGGYDGLSGRSSRDSSMNWWCYENSSTKTFVDLVHSYFCPWPNLTRMTNQAFSYYLMPAAGSFVHLLPEPAGSGSRSTNIWVDKYSGRRVYGSTTFCCTKNSN
jgi:hypothetical protein